MRNEATEDELKLLEWLFFSALCINGMKPDIGLTEWKKLIRNGDKFNGDYNEKIPIIMEYLKKEVKRAEEIEKFITSLSEIDKKKASKISYRELNDMVEHFSKCKIPLKDEQKALEHLSSRCRKISDRVNRLLIVNGNDRAVLTEFKSMQEHI